MGEPFHFVFGFSAAGADSARAGGIRVTAPHLGQRPCLPAFAAGTCSRPPQLAQKNWIVPDGDPGGGR